MYDLNTDYFIYINYWDFGGSIFVSSRVAKKQTKSAERYSFVSWLTANWLFLCFSLLKCCSWFCMVFLVTQYVHFKIRHYWGNREKQQQEPLAKGRDFRHAFFVFRNHLWSHLSVNWYVRLMFHRFVFEYIKDLTLFNLCAWSMTLEKQKWVGGPNF